MPPSELPRRRPGPHDLASAKSYVSPPPPSALTARVIENLSDVEYPDGIKRPMIELNANVRDGRFRYDRDFLIQFMNICKEKPPTLPPLDILGIEPVDQSSFAMARGGSGRHRKASSAMPPSANRQASIGLGIGGFQKPSVPSPFQMGNFQSGSKLTSEERIALSPDSRSTSVGGATLPFNRTPSQGGPDHPMGSNRTRSKRGEKRGDSNKKSPLSQQGRGSSCGSSSVAPMLGASFEPVVPLEMSANRWVPTSSVRNAQPDVDTPEMVDRKVKALLNKLTMESFDSISEQIIQWANKSVNKKDRRALIQVIRLIFEMATDEGAWSEIYARLCRKMMEQISPGVQDDGTKNLEGKPIAGGQLFRMYLLSRYREDFEREWFAKETTTAAAAVKASDDQATKDANEKQGMEKAKLYLNEYYAAHKAKRHGLGLMMFIGELFKLQILTEPTMHKSVMKLLGNIENRKEEEIERLCQLLKTVGQLLDTPKARAHMDVYFTRMKELGKSSNVSFRMQFLLQDVIELRERKWISRNAVAAPMTIAAVHEAAAKDRAAAEKESYNRQASLSRGGSRRGGDRDQEYGPDGWAVAGGPPSRPPPNLKSGDLSQFGKISKGAHMIMGPSSVFAGAKDSKRESFSRTSSNSNMFQMLSPNPMDRSPEAIALRKKLQVLPRFKPSGTSRQKAED